MAAQTQGLAFKEFVAAPLVAERYPESYWQDRRIEFNRLGEAEVKGLSSGTYRIVHWRPDLAWGKDPIEVREGIVTRVRLVD